MQKNYDARRQKLRDLFQDNDMAEVISPLIDEIVELERRMDELRQLPFIQIHPKNRAIQKVTPASRQYKECSQSYMNGIRILIGILKKDEPTAADELAKKLEDFML